MRAFVVLGLAFVLGCGASQAAMPAAVATSDSIISKGPADAAGLAQAALGAMIDPNSPPSSMQATIAGRPGLNGNYTLAMIQCSKGGAHAYVPATAAGRCSKCDLAYLGHKYRWQSTGAEIDIFLEAGNGGHLEFLVYQAGGAFSPIASHVGRPPQDGTFGLTGGGTVTISAVP